MRFYNGQPIELLAPAGTFDIFESVVQAKCDAVYFGGSILNMRLIRKGYNFSNDELKAAVDMAHGLGKKAYITVNNLFGHEDLEAARPYLTFLESVQPDALIVQDFGVFELLKTLNLSLELHSSVMMNVHNLASIQALEAMGVTRVVCSREMSLEAIRKLKTQTDMEIEYFTHGDMCVAHGAQCLYSGMLFGMSSNRGRCLKPCRWSYDMAKDGHLYEPGFPLAVKDMSLFERLPDLITSGVTSFKIEGRMREKAFITNLINLYGEAIDRYLEAPESFDPTEGAKVLFDGRKRDLSTGYAFGKPGLSNINSRYEGTGKFYSTGKVFSKPTEETAMDEAVGEKMMTYLTNAPKRTSARKLSVRVENIDQAKMCLEEGVDVVYLSSEPLAAEVTFTEEAYEEILENKGDTKVYLSLPKMMTDEQFKAFDRLLIERRIPFDGVLCTNIGAIHRYRGLGYDLVGDTTLNCYNHQAIKTYKEAGLSGVTVSLESPLEEVAHMALHSQCPLEITVHGHQTVMYLEHDLYENTQVFDPVGQGHNRFVGDEVLTLRTPVGEYPVYKDSYGRNHMMAAKELCYLPILEGLCHVGYERFRIEGSVYSTDVLRTILRGYQEKLRHPLRPVSLVPRSEGYTFGPLKQPY